MSSSGAKRRLVSSLIDRLAETSSHATTSAVRLQGSELQQLKVDVARDLENLLNTRRRSQPCPPELREVSGSLVEYGIPDFTGLNMSVPSERERIRVEVERVIRRFEPRLHSVAVAVLANTDRADRTLRLRITGVLRTEPVAERVVFDSEVEPTSVAIEIKAVP